VVGLAASVSKQIWPRNHSLNCNEFKITSTKDKIPIQFTDTLFSRIPTTTSMIELLRGKLFPKNNKLRAFHHTGTWIHSSVKSVAGAVQSGLLKVPSSVP
jgi:hypothetical protein